MPFLLIPVVVGVMFFLNPELVKKRVPEKYSVVRFYDPNLKRDVYAFKDALVGKGGNARVKEISIYTLNEGSPVLYENDKKFVIRASYNPTPAHIVQNNLDSALFRTSRKKKDGRERFYTVYEQGCDLHHYILQSKNPYVVNSKIALDLAIATGLLVHFMHSKKIVHGDLKPSNILKHTEQLSLSDFDSSRIGVCDKEGSFDCTPVYRLHDLDGATTTYRQIDLYALMRIWFMPPKDIKKFCKGMSVTWIFPPDFLQSDPIFKQIMNTSSGQLPVDFNGKPYSLEQLICAVVFKKKDLLKFFTNGDFYKTVFINQALAEYIVKNADRTLQWNWLDVAIVQKLLMDCRGKNFSKAFENFKQYLIENYFIGVRKTNLFRNELSIFVKLPIALPVVTAKPQLESEPKQEVQNASIITVPSRSPTSRGAPNFFASQSTNVLSQEKVSSGSEKGITPDEEKVSTESDEATPLCKKPSSLYASTKPTQVAEENPKTQGCPCSVM